MKQRLSSKPLINPILGESPVSYANRLGQAYLSSSLAGQKKELAQYFTPPEVATFMAEMTTSVKKAVKVLDPGAGSGVLACAICEFLAEQENKPSEIDLVAYEIDTQIISALNDSLQYLASWLESKKIKMTYQIVNKDFVLDKSYVLKKEITLFGKPNLSGEFDYIISNPPYFKLPKSDPRAKAAISIIHGQPNIYALFMAIAAYLLNIEGEMIFITPRSYAAGPYFRLFREVLLSEVTIKALHLFESRTNAFDRDAVLQENVILKAKKEPLNSNSSVRISHSYGINDLKDSPIRLVPLNEVIDLNTKNKVIRIPLGEEDDKVIKLIHSWSGSLHGYNLNISTGPVVPFRAREYIMDSTDSVKTTPLFWMQNVKPMQVKWPVKGRKQQFLKLTPESQKLLVANKNYVLMRRFSAKEEKRRLVTAPYLKNNFESEAVAFENHLNYIYKTDGEFSPEEAVGLSAILNSSLFDNYFRTSNGNTQVSATEIRDMPLPPIEVINEIGRCIINNKIAWQDIDKVLLEK